MAVWTPQLKKNGPWCTRGRSFCCLRLCLEVLPRRSALVRVLAGRHTTHGSWGLTWAVLAGLPRRERTTHVLKLLLGCHLLGEERGLNAVEQPFEPSDELCLGNAQLGVRRRLIVERQGDSLELVDQLGSQALLQLADRAAVDLGKAGATGMVQRRAAHLLEQLFDHGGDPHDLARMLDQVGGVAALLAAGPLGYPHPVLGDHDHPPALVVVSRALLLVALPIAGCVHGPILHRGQPVPLPRPGIPVSQRSAIRDLSMSRLSSNLRACFSSSSMSPASSVRAASPSADRPSSSKTFQNRSTGSRTSSLC